MELPRQTHLNHSPIQKTHNCHGMGYSTMLLRRRSPGKHYRYVRWRWRVFCALIDGIGTFLWGVFRLLGQRSQEGLRSCQRIFLFFRALVGGKRGLLARPKEEKRAQTPQRILVIQLDHLGDAVISQVIFPLLHQRYPEAEIHVLASPWNQEIFQMLPEVQRIHVWAGNRFQRCGGAGEGNFGWLRKLRWVGELWIWGWRLRLQRYDLGIDVRGELPHAVLMWLAGIRRRVGWASGGGRFLLTDWPSYRPARPELYKRLDILKCLGIEPASPRQTLWPQLPPPPWAKQSLVERFPELAKACSALQPESTDPQQLLSPRRAPGPARPLVVCHIGAGTEAKQWPFEHWSELIAQLLSRPLRVVLVGGKSDQAKAARLLENLPADPSRLSNTTGKLRLQELAALLEQADLLIGADSGPAHLAAAVGRPVVVLFSGASRLLQWRPRGPWVQVLRHRVPCQVCHRPRCPSSDHPCMRGIQPEEVLRALDRVLEASFPPSLVSQRRSSDHKPFLPLNRIDGLHKLLSFAN